MKAFQRLQEEIIKTSHDHSLFAWNPQGSDKFRNGLSGLLATSPGQFRDMGDVYVGGSYTAMEPYSMTNLGLRITFFVASKKVDEDDELVGDHSYTALLNCSRHGIANGPVAIQLRQLGSVEFARMARIPTRMTDLETVRTWTSRTIYVRQDNFSEREHGFAPGPSAQGPGMLRITLTPPSPGDQKNKYSDRRRGYRLVAQYPRPRSESGEHDIIPTILFKANEEPAFLFVEPRKGNFIVWMRRLSSLKTGRRWSAYLGIKSDDETLEDAVKLNAHLPFRWKKTGEGETTSMVKTGDRSKAEEERIVVNFRPVEGSAPKQSHYCLTIEVHPYPTPNGDLTSPG
jgi:hypothetical protein